MTEALGLGGFPHFAAHPFVWFQTLGFRMQEVPFSRTIGAGAVTKRLLRALGKELPVPTAVGLERGGEVLIKPFCPPYHRNMEEAVLAFVERKYARERARFATGAPPRAGGMDPVSRQASHPTRISPSLPRSPTVNTCTNGTGDSPPTAVRSARCSPTRPITWIRTSTIGSTVPRH
jgi:hypothetical protein